ncbi:calpain-10 isoform X1 [Pelobates cultripes]|uniref:Calpain-10 isoform X1 n=1 Tax=Pelobates cultripes TaxID=61616 RepID=A0AAD1RCQ2_PELCU|nr:calpain-10 isoform X1 [Pelobates cultripes]
MLPTSSGLFVDPEFPASVSSLICGAGTPLSILCDRITWLRPQEIIASPRLFPLNARDGLGKQGILGDCWFICACSALQKCEKLLRQVFPVGQCLWTDPGYTGKFTCRFWRFGFWVEVTIDDRLPCLGHKLCFSHCQDQGSFWLPLLEKAYAKLHGCYESLWAGQVADALVDLTGGLVERWAFGAGEEHVRREMFNKMLELKERCAMTCSVLHYREGAKELGEFHAFTITDIQNVVAKDGQELLMLRVHNPWGRCCWDGSWSKSGHGWDIFSPKVVSNLQSKMQEGEFWVEKSEFIQDFDELTMAFPVNEKGQILNIWSGLPLISTQEVYGSWVKGQSAGGSRNNVSFPDNPKFWLRVKEQCQVYLTLNQRPLHGTGATQNKDSLYAIGLHVWKVEKRKFNLTKTLSSPPVVGTSSHSYERQFHLYCELSPGYHLLVPSTFLRDTEADFLLRVLSTGHVTLSEIVPPRSMAPASEDVTQRSWDIQTLQGSWKKGKNAGGSRNFPSYHLNPSLPFSVPKECQLVKVTLLQQCQEDKCHAIGFHVYSVSRDKQKSPLSGEPSASCVPHSHSQEVSQVCVLSPGKYLLVPSTYLPEQECGFTVTIATKVDRKPIESQETLGRFLQEVCVITVMK